MNHNVARFTAGHNLLNGGLYIYIKWWSWSPLRRGKEETTTNLCTSHTCANFRKQVNPEAKAWWWWWRRHGSHSTGVNDHFSLFAEIIRDKPMKHEKRGSFSDQALHFGGNFHLFFHSKDSFFSAGKQKKKLSRRGFCFLVSNGFFGLCWRRRPWLYQRLDLSLNNQEFSDA